MSTTASDHADALDTAARRARAVAARFTDATLRVLWDDGPLVFVADHVGADRIDIRMGDKLPAVYPYVEVDVDDADRPARVYEDQRWPKFTHSVLEGLRLHSPDVYATIVNEVNR